MYSRLKNIGWVSPVFLWMILSGCDPAFEPLQEIDRYFFSIYGYLDASADTNWIRVMPVRDQLWMEPEPTTSGQPCRSNRGIPTVSQPKEKTAEAVL